MTQNAVAPVVGAFEEYCIVEALGSWSGGWQCRALVQLWMALVVEEGAGAEVGH